MILSTILLQLHELLLQEPEHLQPGLVLLLLQHRGRHHGHETLQVDSRADWDGVSKFPALYIRPLLRNIMYVRVQVLNDMECTSECCDRGAVSPGSQGAALSGAHCIQYSVLL